MLRVLTWNLNGLDDHRLDERMEAAVLGLLLTGDPPEVLLLQEVVDRALVAHLRPHLSGCGYALAVQPAAGEYGCAAAVRRPLRMVEARMHPFDPSPQGRALVEIEAVHDGVRWRFGTAHLESGPRAGAERAAQLDACLRVIGSHDGPAVFAGDTNLREDEAREVPDRHGVRDAWVALGRPEAGRSTWRPPARGASRWFRFDRAYVNRRAHPLSLSTVDLRTMDARRDPVSDHLGLVLHVAAT